MAKMDSILEKAMKAGKEIEQRKTAKSLEYDQAAAAVTAAAADMEAAALAGDETAYAQAKQRRAAAENRLEIMQIREKNKTGGNDLHAETLSVLQTLEADSLEEIKKYCREFLSRYEEIVKFIDQVDNYAQRYNQVQEYFKSYVLKSTDYKCRYMIELFPQLVHVLDFKRKFRFQYSTLNAKLYPPSK